MSPEIAIRVRFRTRDEGGRSSPIQSDSYSCPMIIDDEAFDCRISFGTKITELGVWTECRARFLSPEMVIPKIHKGLAFKLWEGKIVADGESI